MLINFGELTRGGFSRENKKINISLFLLIYNHQLHFKDLVFFLSPSILFLLSQQTFGINIHSNLCLCLFCKKMFSFKKMHFTTNLQQPMHAKNVVVIIHKCVRLRHGQFFQSHNSLVLLFLKDRKFVFFSSSSIPFFYVRGMYVREYICT